MRKLNQAGLSALEAVLLLVIVIILAATGVYVYKSQNNANKTLDAADKSATSQKAVTSNKTETECQLSDGKVGKTVTVSNVGLTFCEPNGWTLSYTGSGGFTANSTAELNYDAQKNAETKKVGGSDGPRALAIGYPITDKTTAGFTLTSSTKTAAGDTLDTYEYTTGSEDPIGAGISYLPEGSKLYTFIVTKDTKKLSFSHTVQPGETDLSELIQIVASSTK